MTAPAYIDPTTGLAIGYKATKGTTAEPFLVPMAWQASTLSYVALSVDAAGALQVTGGGGGGGGTSSTFGAAFPATGTAAGFKDAGGNMAAGLLDGSGFLKVNVAAGGAGGGAVTVADGADVAEGATTDAAVTTDVAGTVSGKLRGLVKWAFERMPASLGQKVMASSLPVAIASDQSAIPVTQSGTWTVQQGTPPWTVSQSGTWNIGTVTTVTSITNPVAVTGPLTDAQLRATPVPVSGTVSVNVGLTDAQLRATPVPVSGTVTSTQGGAPWSENITQWGSAATSLGQKASTASVPVVLASDGIGSGAGNPMFISGSISASSTATATAMPPLYAEAAVAAFSQDLSGNLRVHDSFQDSLLAEMRSQSAILRTMQLQLAEMSGVHINPADLMSDMHLYQ